MKASGNNVHRLLEKQITRSKRPDGSLDVEALLRLVSAAYDEADRERRRTDRSMTLMTEELGALNVGLIEQVKARTSELEQSNARLAAALENINQGVVMLDPEGHVTIFNPKYAELTGMRVEDCQGNPPFTSLVRKMLESGEFDPMGEAFKDWVRKSGQHPGASSFQRTRPDGTILQVQTARLAGGGEVRTVSDITRHVRASEEIDAVRKMLEATLENVTQGIMKFDAQRRIVFFNQRAAELLGLPEGFLERGQTLQSLLNHQIESGEFEGMDEAFIQFVRSGGVSLKAQVYERKRPNGTVLEIRTVPLHDGSYVRMYTDMTEFRQREHDLVAAQEEYRSLFENATVGIYRTTLDGRQIRANPALVRMNGYDSEGEMIAEVSDIGRQWYVDPRRRTEFVAAMQRDGRVADFVSEVTRYKTGERYWASEAAWLVRDKDGTPLCYEGLVIDATDRKKAENEIAHIALHDMLTNLPNRTLFIDTLKSALLENRRGHEIAVLCLDLDHFKDVNDTMGHDCGDILLRMAARRVQRALPAKGMAARFGGDEFAVILPEIREQESVFHLAREIVRALSTPFRIRGKRVYVGASIGISMAPSDGLDAQELLKMADIALYRAKRDGRGTYACFDAAMTAAIMARREVEAELRRAVANNEFRIFYQPIVDLETDTPIAYEALVRWQHPTKGLLSPAYFIDIAEESGLIAQIGEIVLEEACHCIARVSKDARISVNLSPVQFRNHQLAVTVVNALASSGLPPHRLALEITESVLLTDDAHTLEILRQLRTLGVQIALDDFGIGHSSLSYLQKFPFDKIKIDKSFVQCDIEDTMSTAIRRAVLGLGHDLGVEVIVEGVETQLQRDMLIYEGCRYVQGYFYGKPQPASVIFADQDAEIHIAAA